MIELEAEILRGSCTPVFFVGETIECEIRFKSINKQENTNSTNNKFLNKKKNSLNSNEITINLHESASNSNFNSNTFSNDDTSNSIDTNRINEINESMFSMLSTLSTTSSKSTSMTSLAVTPTPSNGSINSNKKPSKSSSIFTFDRISSSNTEQDLGEQSIAWACAQIDCHCFIDESKVNLPKDPLRYNLNNEKNELSNTSFQPNKDRIGISVFSSKPKILFCNLTLFPNQTKSCMLLLIIFIFYLCTKD
jgi:hypothetical protein